MPRVSEFFGIVVTMYYHDHPPPHFHVRYAEHRAAYGIDSLALLRGELPRRAHALVLEWATLHREELRINWDRARSGRTPKRIDPLD